MNTTPIEHLRHTWAHVLGASLLELYPDAKLTLGPAIDDGFYYDAELPVALTEADLKTIQKTMKKLLNKWDTFEHREVSHQEALEYYANNPYKKELIEEIVARGESITLYTCGGFTDLCRGGHALHPNKELDTDAFTLHTIAGAYWRGDEKNVMLTRVYGYAFATKTELDAHLAMLEEARKRDHRKLGAELGIFTLSPLVGSGLPLFKPRGTIIRRELESYLWELHAEHGYDRVWTPHLAKAELYHTSGHGQHYLDDMFSVYGGTSKENFYLKPMNCPHHMQIFADNHFSYRDMPVRYFEPATVYRDEKTGQLGGLTRVRAITQDDGHLFCRVAQISQEIKTIVSIIKQFYTTMGMIEGYRVRLSLRDDNKANYLGSDEVWKSAESALKSVCDDEGLPYFEGKGEAAFYGPKLDFMFRDAIGREHQLATVQCDFNLPERFDLSFINEEGKKERPVVIHRAISGSLERFMGVMIEHFAGAFPVWLAPVQLAILPVADAHSDYARDIQQALKALAIRTEFLEATDSLGKRIRHTKTNKIPLTIVVGDKDIASQSLTLEIRGVQDSITTTLPELSQKLTEAIRTRALSLLY
jgi:threonyl-tRNA synthetase